MRVSLVSALAASVSLAGCVHYQPASVSSASLDSRFQTPVQVVTGVSSAHYIFGIGPLGEDSLLAAYKDAIRKGDGGDTLVNVAVDRKLTCVPFCGFALFTSVETMVMGTLVRYSDENGKRLPPSFEERGLVVGKDGNVSASKGVSPNAWISFFKSITPGSMVAVTFLDGSVYEGEFRWFSDADREFLVKPAGSTFSGKVISLGKISDVRLVKADQGLKAPGENQ